MAKRYVVSCLGVLVILSSLAVWGLAQDGAHDNSGSIIRVVVSMVQLNVAVTDEKGNYVTNLRPSDFDISEDGIPQKVATFEEGNEGPQTVLDAAKDSSLKKGPGPDALPDHRRIAPARGNAMTGALEGIDSSVSGSNVFILFDTSNYMFSGRVLYFSHNIVMQFVRR